MDIMRKIDDMPDDILYLINGYLDYRCRVCNKKLPFNNIPLIHNKKYYYCSQNCYLFI